MIGIPAVTKTTACIFGGLITVGLAHEGIAQTSDLRWYGGVTVVGLSADDGHVSAEQTLSSDLFIVRESTRGRWFLYLEGNSSLGSDGVSTVLSETNADAATATDPDGGGRIQISEINYRFSRRNGGGLTLGLVDPTAYLDRTRITNDENVQFLGTSFVNNPTIGFPDYTIGLVYERPRDVRVPQLNVVVTSARGLADNPDLSYSDLVRLQDDNDGLFAAIGFGWPSERHLIRAGAWINTKPHRALAGDADDGDNYGAYFVYDHSSDPHGFNVRAGIANDTVSRAAKFVALAYEYSWRQHALGLGISHTMLSAKLRDPDLDDSIHFEAFGRFTISDRVHLTASYQRLLHSGFVARESDPRNSARVAGLRFHYSF